MEERLVPISTTELLEGFIADSSRGNIPVLVGISK
jgi:hypothetical protein